MKHSTFRKSSLISSVALLLVAIVALSGATFAWFSANNEATANGIKLQASAASGLQIKEKASDNWSSSITWTNSVATLTPASSAFESKSAPVFHTGNAAAIDKYDVNEDGFDPVGYTNYVNTYSAILATADGKAATLKVQLTDLVDAGNYGRIAITDGTNLLLYYSAANDVAVNPVDKDGNVATTNPFAGADYLVGAAETEVELCQIAANSSVSLTIYVWNEGQDNDCTSNSAGAALETNFKFYI